MKEEEQILPACLPANLEPGTLQNVCHNEAKTVSSVVPSWHLWGETRHIKDCLDRQYLSKLHQAFSTKEGADFLNFTRIEQISITNLENVKQSLSTSARS